MKKRILTMLMIGSLFAGLLTGCSESKVSLNGDIAKLKAEI